MSRGAEPAGKSEPSFESALARLEAIVERLESGDLPLEEALAAFEEGVALSRRCTAELEAAERRIEILVGVTGGVPATVPFEPAAVEDPAD
jgi:exodeoxyribonuclease VII small subunit